MLFLISLVFIISMFYGLFIIEETRKLPFELWHYYQDYTKVGIVRKLAIWFLWSGGWIFIAIGKFKLSIICIACSVFLLIILGGEWRNE